ncbi:phage/plasmid primase, P4 family [Priestia sp. SB1]|uniref:DNA primase family protein n=1 Tax=Priestia sp. SB1 TaxID=3132359 RepID=UPI00317BEB00
MSKRIKKELPSHLSLDNFWKEEGGNLKLDYIKLGNTLIEEYNIFGDGSTAWYYNNGYYHSDAETFINSIITQILAERYSKTSRMKTLDYIINSCLLTEDSMHEFNKYDGYINVKNGLIHIETGELHTHNKERISTIQFPITYNKDANEQIIIDFIKSIVPNDCVPIIFEMIGYCLIPSTKYEKAFMFTGSGANGKSVLIELIKHLIGMKNTSAVTLQELETDRFKSAQLYRKSINVCADLSYEGLKETETFKRIVTGDVLSAQFKGIDSFDYNPFAKLIFSSNVIPRSRDTTDGYFRRWTIIPFPNKFEGDKADRNLINKLTTDESLSALLNLALQGLQRLIKNGDFTQSSTIDRMLQEYKNDSDDIQSFIYDTCELDSEGDIYVSELYNTYKNYCIENKIHNYLGKKHFNKAIESKFNFQRKRIKRGDAESWIGIRQSQETATNVLEFKKVAHKTTH